MTIFVGDPISQGENVSNSGTKNSARDYSEKKNMAAELVRAMYKQDY